MTSAAAAPNADEHPMMGPGRGRLEGKVAVVTGANSGIGRAAARLFAREGAKVVCVDVAEVITPRIDALIESDGGEAAFFQGDVTSAESCQGMVNLALERFGDLDILVNNAGAGVWGRVDQLSEGDWKRIVDLNLTGVFLGSKAALPHMMSKGKGSIVNTASTFGLLGTASYAVYSASKGGVVLLTRSMAIDYGPMGIRVNCICPRRDGDAPAVEDSDGRQEPGGGRGLCGRRRRHQSGHPTIGSPGGDRLRDALPGLGRGFVRHRPRPRRGRRPDH